MRSIHVYVCETDEIGEIRVCVLRSVNDIFTRGRDGAASGRSVLIHVGVNRPSDEEVKRVLAQWDSVVLLTAAARWALSGESVKHLAEIGYVEIRGCVTRVPVYLALSGWGYEKDIPNTCLDSSENQVVPPQTTSQSGHNSELDPVERFWKQLDSADPADHARLLSVSTGWIKQALSRESSQGIARRAPKWLRNNPIAILPLRVRTRNCLLSLGMECPLTVGELANWPDERLLNVRAFGRTSLRDLKATLLDLLVAGPGGCPPRNGIDNNGSLSARWAACRASLSSQQSDILLDELQLSPRPNRVLMEQGIKTVGQLAELNDEDLFSFDTFGRRSLQDVVEAIESLVGAQCGTTDEFVKPGDETRSMTTPLSYGLYHNLDNTLARLPNDHRRVIEGRLGSAGQTRTLQAIGDDIGLSKERVRQIERKQIRAIVDEELWDDELRDRLGKALSSRTIPLSLAILPALDPWFGGFEDNVDFLSGVIQTFGEGVYHCWDLDGVGRVVSRSTYDQWLEMHKRACELLDNAHEGTVHVGDVRRYSSMVAKSANAIELTDALTDLLLSEAVLAGNPDDPDTRVLSRTKQVGELCISVLYDSDVPLHYAEVKCLVEEQVGHTVQERRIHGALSRECFLYGRGTYGLLKHLNIDDQTSAEVCNETVEFVRAGAPGRQWHSQELLELLRDNQVFTEQDITPYKLSIMLREVDELEYLGRQIWMFSEGEDSSVSRRMIADLVEDAIRNAGKPLSTDEVWCAVSKVRGIGKFRLVPESQRVIRVSRAQFGLIDRDLGLSQQELQQWAKIVESKMDEIGSLSIKDIESLQQDTDTPGVRNQNTNILTRVAAKIHGWRVTRAGELMRAPIGLKAAES